MQSKVKIILSVAGMYAMYLCVALLSGCSRYEAGYKDYTLWYDTPAVEWEEALPVGNGRLGAMIFGNPFH